MNIFNRRSPLKLDRESILACWLILLFGGWLLLNFWLGFNFPVYLVAAVFGLAVPLVYPRAGFYALTFLMLVFTKFFTLQSLIINQQEYKFYLVDILFTAILLGLVPRLAKGKLKLPWRWPDLTLLAFCFLTAVYFVLSVVSWEGSFALSFSSFKNYAFYPLFYFVAYLLLGDRQKIKIWLQFVLAGATAIIGFIIYGLINGRGLWTEITPLSTIGSRILDFDHAFYLCLIFLFGFVYLLFRRGAATRWLFALLPIWLVGIIGSLMRHLWLALVLALVSLYLLLPAAKRALARQLVASYAVIMIMLAVLAIGAVNVLPFSNFSRTYHDTLNQLSSRAVSLANPDDTSLAWRSAVWASVWEKYKNNIIGGLGFGQKVFIDMGDYRDYIEVRNAHNSFLAIFVQMGLLGFFLFALFGAGVVAKLLRQPATPDRAVAKYSLLGIIIFCVAAFLFQPYLEANWFSIPFWLSLGLAKRTYEGFAG